MFNESRNAQAMTSKRLLRDSLFQLMEERSFDEITVTEICQKADIVRQTFYRNFSTKDDVLLFHLDELMREYQQQFQDRTMGFRYQFDKLFFHLSAHKKELSLIERYGLFHLVDDTVQRYCRRCLFKECHSCVDPNSRGYYIDYFSAVLCSILKRWIQTGFRETGTELAGLATVFFRGIDPDPIDAQGIDKRRSNRRPNDRPE